MKKIKQWFQKCFTTMSIEECKLHNLTFYKNVYGDTINILNCRSFWTDGEYLYRCETLINN